MAHWSSTRPAGSVQLMIGVAAELGVSSATCIAGTGLHGDELVDPTREIAGQQELAVLRNILRALDPSVPFGLLAGQRYRTTTHGAWGFAIRTSNDVLEAIEAGQRYFDLSYSFNRSGGFELEGRQARLILDESDNPDDLRAVLVERDMAAMIAMELELLGEIIPIQQLQLRAPRPAYAAEFERLFGVTPQWNAAVNSVAFDVSMLCLSGRYADRFGHRVSEDLCRTLIDTNRARAGLAGRVRGRILRNPGEFPSMETVAAELGMSLRTLRNRLRRESSSYRALIEEAREALAVELLAGDQMTLDEIAERLGYADTSTFIAAFKRWKGVAPGGYRRQHGA